uniref:Transporter n=1 Tax=Ciona savignyi TaxID=51511 RepID=H2Y7H7_CIOSA
RQKWGKRFDFLLSIVGMTVGLGNIWRFPYLCYKNGGGAFLIPYILSVISIGFPLLFLETSFGQYVGQGMTKAWGMVPLMKGIGLANLMITWYANSLYGVVLAWAACYFVKSFSLILPWTTCSNIWNSDNCVELSHTSVNLSTNNATTPIGNYILKESPGLEHMGGVRWELFCYLIGLWIVAYFCIFKGIKWSTKVVYVTSTLPLVMLVVVLVRGVTLDGAAEGIYFYLNPNMTKLGEPQVWMDAVTQVYYSYGGSGVLVTLASYNKFNHDIYRDSILISLVNSGTSFISGFAVFSTLGFMAKQQNISIEEVAESGPGLVFIIYPQALSMIPHPHIWSALFFLMIIFLGFDCLFVFQECLVVSIMDMFPIWYSFKWGREAIQAMFVLLIVGMATPMVTEVNYLLKISKFVFEYFKKMWSETLCRCYLTPGGIYVFLLLNEYGGAGWCVFFIGTCEFIGLAWIYGVDRYYKHVKEMLPHISATWIKYCWKYVGPSFSMGVLVYWLTLYKPLEYKSTVYPVWAQVLGWCLGLSSCLWIPVFAVVELARSSGGIKQV